MALAVISSSRSTNTMNIFFGIIRRIKLDNPIDLGNIETSRGYIGTKKNTSVCRTKLKEGRGALGLFLFALKDKK